MIYKVLSVDEVRELNTELKNRLPGSAKVFYVIQCFIKGLLPGKEVIVDSWPEWSSVIVRTCDEEQAQPFFRHTYMCHAKTASSLRYFLQRPGVINWQKPAFFTGVPHDVTPVISTMCGKHKARIMSMEARFMYAWTKKEPATVPEIPDDLELGKLTVDDARTLTNDWKGSRYKDDLEGYFRAVIENFDSSCLRDKDGVLQAYACMQFNGSIAMLYVKPEHRKTDYFKIVLSDLARRRTLEGEVAYGFVPANDSNLVAQMRSMDFVWVPRGDMVWMSYEPVKENWHEPAGGTVNRPALKDERDEWYESLDCVCSKMARYSQEAECRLNVIKTNKSMTDKNAVIPDVQALVQPS